jgi:hypothetical protein
MRGKSEIRNSKSEIRRARRTERATLRGANELEFWIRISDFERSEATQAIHFHSQKTGQFRIFLSP